MTIFSGGHVEARKVSQQSQYGHVRDAEGRSAGLPLTPTISPCQKKKEKASVKVSTVAPSNTLHVGAENSFCANRLLGRAHQSRVKALNSNAVKGESKKTS